MRELSLIELDLIIGGYDSNGGDYSYNDSSITYDSTGAFSGDVSTGDIQALATNATTAGISVDFEFETPSIPIIGKIKIKGGFKS